MDTLPLELTIITWTTRIMDWQPRTGKGKRGTSRQRRRSSRRDDIMQEQHEPELQVIEMNGIYMRRDISYTGCVHSLSDDL